MKRASEVPPVVESSALRPVTAAAASETTSTKGPGSVRKASPLTAMRTWTLPANPSPALAASASIQSLRAWPVWAGLKRMFSRALAWAGITLVAGLPTSMVVTSRFDGWNSGWPSSSRRACSAASSRISTGTGLAARCG